MKMNVIEAILDWQAGLDDCRDAVGEALRGVMIKALMDQMQVEAVMLCGPYCQSAPEAAHRRVGSAFGQLRLNGVRRAVCPPAGEAKARPGSVTNPSVISRLKKYGIFTCILSRFHTVYRSTSRCVEYQVRGRAWFRERSSC